jgi:8-oxo-dGTP pyrophosphatase MutT (NUDIX family)
MKLLEMFDRREKKMGYQPITYRDSVRAIIFDQGKLLMVYSQKSDEYKFPGGGLLDGELKDIALKREVLEEVGRKVNSVNESLGYVDQIYNDIYDEKRYFYLRSYYYFCEISDEKFPLNLDVYEHNLKFTPAWVSIDDAINVNQRKFDEGSKYHWTERELFVLKLLKEMLP